MTIPLDRLRDFPLATPEPGQISFAVARHEAEFWPSDEVTAYAQDRSRLLHQLVDDAGIQVESWGETDGPIPREVVEMIIAISGPIISAIGVVVAAWIGRTRKAKEADLVAPKPPPETNAALPGMTFKRPDGAELMITYRDQLSAKEIQRVVTDFLGQAIPEPTA